MSDSETRQDLSEFGFTDMLDIVMGSQTSQLSQRLDEQLGSMNYLLSGLGSQELTEFDNVNGSQTSQR